MTQHKQIFNCHLCHAFKGTTCNTVLKHHLTIALSCHRSYCAAILRQIMEPLKICGQKYHHHFRVWNTDGVKAVDLSETKGLRWRDVSLGEMLAWDETNVRQHGWGVGWDEIKENQPVSVAKNSLFGPSRKTYSRNSLLHHPPPQHNGPLHFLDLARSHWRNKEVRLWLSVNAVHVVGV